VDIEIKEKTEFDIVKPRIQETLDQYPSIRDLGFTPEEIFSKYKKFNNQLLIGKYHPEFAALIMDSLSHDDSLEKINYLLKKINKKYPRFKPNLRMLLLDNFASPRLELYLLGYFIDNDIKIEELEPSIGKKNLDVKIKPLDRSIYVEAVSPLSTLPPLPALVKRVKHSIFDDKGLHQVLADKAREKQIDKLNAPLIMLIDGVYHEYTLENVRKALEYDFLFKEKISAIELDDGKEYLLIENKYAEIPLDIKEFSRLTQPLDFVQKFRLKLKELLVGFDGFSEEDILKKDEKIAISPRLTITYSTIWSRLKYDIFTVWPFRKRIVVTEGVLKRLNKQELKAVLLHEQGHLKFNAKFTLLRLILTILFLAFVILIGSITVLLKISWIFLWIFTGMIIAFIALNLYSFRILEVICDVYAIKKSNKDVFLAALKKYSEMQKLNPKSSGFGKFWGNLTHPPYEERVKLINFFLKYGLSLC
jgi:hypothetical protein